MGHPRNRAERRFHRKRVIKNRVRDYEIWYEATTPGKYAKKKPYDCGHAQCYMCHSEKLDTRTKHVRRHAWKKEVDMMLDL